MNESQRIFKNVFASGVGTAMGGILQFVAVLLVARALGPATFGLFACLATMAFVLNRIADLGMSAILVRDFSVNPRITGNLLGSALSLAWLLLLGTSLAIAGVVQFVPIAAHVELVTVLMAVSGLLQLPCACYGAVMRAREENELEVLGFFAHKLVLLLGLCVALRLNCGLQAVAIIYVGSAAAQWTICREIVRRRYLRPRWRIDVADWRYLVKESIPFGWSAAIRLVGEQADVMILAWVAGLSAVGLYGGVYRITVGLRFVAQAMVIAIFPAYSRAASHFMRAPVRAEDSRLQRMYQLAIRSLLLIALPVATALFVAATPVVDVLLGPDYLPAVGALRILAITAGIVFIASPFPYLLTALNEHRFLFVSSTAVTTVRTILLCGFSAWLGITGAAWAVLISEGMLLAVWMAYLANRNLTSGVGSTVWKGAAAAFVMAMVLYLSDARTATSMVAAVLLAAAAYAVMVFKLKALSDAELAMAAEGMRFFRPMINGWSWRPRSRPTLPEQAR